jgi:hypothetical protein
MIPISGSIGFTKNEPTVVYKIMYTIEMINQSRYSLSGGIVNQFYCDFIFKMFTFKLVHKKNGASD